MAGWIEALCGDLSAETGIPARHVDQLLQALAVQVKAGIEKDKAFLLPYVGLIQKVAAGGGGDEPPGFGSGLGNRKKWVPPPPSIR